MRMYDIIHKKRHGKELTKEEIEFFVKGFTLGNIEDAQAAALCMAVMFVGMSDEETACLTLAMAESGDTVDLSMFESLSVDKHSTGGVGDKVSLIVGPMVAATGKDVYVARDYSEKQMQRALLQFARPANAPIVRKALIKAGREDLIGFGKDCLVRPETQNNFKKPAPKINNRKPQGNKPKFSNKKTKR